MSTLSRHLQNYLALRRRLGFKLIDVGRALRAFVLFAREQKASFITTKLALLWATQPKDCHPARCATRLRAVRGFAGYLSTVDARTEIPPQGLLPHRYQRKTPYFYSDQEVSELVAAAEKLPGPNQFRAATYSTLFGLLAVTGMRIGEAIGLNRNDVDPDQPFLTVHKGKGEKSRLVPLHATAHTKLRDYGRLRDNVSPRPKSATFFISEQGARLTHVTVSYWFIRISHQIGLRRPTDRVGPRIHDLRHRFAMQTILNWYREDIDVEAHLPELATYLGHGHVADTYWYISATPELLSLASKRMECQQGEQPA